MITDFLITFREALEAALVVGIVLAYLQKTKQVKFNNVIYVATAIAIVASVLFAFVFNEFAGGFTGRSEAIFEGATMLFAAFLLTTMILWMFKQKHVRHEIENKVQLELTEKHILGLFFLVFLSVLREGIETVIFLGATGFSSDVNVFERLIGGFLGIIFAISLGFLIFVEAKKLDIKKFFNATSIVLIFFAAGLVAHGVHELQEGGLIPVYVEEIWNINPPRNSDGTYPILHEKGFIGSIAKSLLGYNGNPALLEVLSYLFYMILVLALYKNIEKVHKII